MTCVLLCVILGSWTLSCYPRELGRPRTSRWSLRGKSSSLLVPTVVTRPFGHACRDRCLQIHKLNNHSCILVPYPCYLHARESSRSSISATKNFFFAVHLSFGECICPDSLGQKQGTKEERTGDPRGDPRGTCEAFERPIFWIVQHSKVKGCLSCNSHPKVPHCLNVCLCSCGFAWRVLMVGALQVIPPVGWLLWLLHIGHRRNNHQPIAFSNAHCSGYQDHTNKDLILWIDHG